MLLLYKRSGHFAVHRDAECSHKAEILSMKPRLKDPCFLLPRLG